MEGDQAVQTTASAPLGVQRYVVSAYLVVGVLAWVTIAKFLGLFLETIAVGDPALLGSNFKVSTLVGLITSAGLTMYAYRHEKLMQFSAEVVGELKKVTWPTREETYVHTRVVLITALLMAALMSVLDLVWAQVTGVIYK
ncbi:MAG: preprotein translocase subunit SecE [Deltaproteobacteria bacterium]|nr:preprotein translocase subunit SecE [Deltaproteobacteria bacterium]